MTRRIYRITEEMQIAAQKAEQQQERIPLDLLRQTKSLYMRLYNKLWMCEGHKERKFQESDERIDARKVTEKLSVWEKLVLKTQNFNVDLYGYIFYALRKLVPTRREVYPKMLLEEELMAEYLQVRAYISSNEEVAWKSQEQTFRCLVAQYAAIQEFAQNTGERQQRQFVLLQKDLPFSPLFLFVQAADAGLLDVCRRVQEDAFLQYSIHPFTYNNILQEYGFSKEKVYDLLTSNTLGRGGGVGACVRR